MLSPGIAAPPNVLQRMHALPGQSLSELHTVKALLPPRHTPALAGSLVSAPVKQSVSAVQAVPAFIPPIHVPPTSQSSSPDTRPSPHALTPHLLWISSQILFPGGLSAHGSPLCVLQLPAPSQVSGPSQKIPSSHVVPPPAGGPDTQPPVAGSHVSGPLHTFPSSGHVTVETCTQDPLPLH